MAKPEGFEFTGVFYCTLHNGVANEDSNACDFWHPYDAPKDEYGEPVVDCVFHPCYYDPSEVR